MDLTPEEKEIIRDKIVEKLYDFGIYHGIPRKQFPTVESVQNKTDIFSFINSLFVSQPNESEDSAPIIANYLALMNFGELICKKSDSLISSEEKNSLNVYGPLTPFLLIARQLAEAFHVTINVAFFGNDPDNPNNTCTWVTLKTTEPKLISSINIFLTKDLCFAGKLVCKKYWDSEKIYGNLVEIKTRLEGKQQPAPVNIPRNNHPNNNI